MFAVNKQFLFVSVLGSVRETKVLQDRREFGLVRSDDGKLLQSILFFLSWSPDRVEIGVTPKHIIETGKETVFQLR